MDKIFEKIGSYNIFNHLVPGVIFIACLKLLVGLDLTQKDIIIGAFFYYFIGIIINSFGSVCVEWFFKQIKIINHEPYESYVRAEKKDPKIPILQEVANMHRGLISGCLLVLLALIVKSTGILDIQDAEQSLIIVTIILVVILLMSYYVKQSNYIVRRIKASNVLDGNMEDGRNE